MTLADFFRAMAKKAEITITPEMEAAITGDAPQIPAEAVDQVQNNLFGFNQAVNNADIRNKVFGVRLDKMENAIKATLSELGIDADQYTTLRGSQRFDDFVATLPSAVYKRAEELTKGQFSGKDGDRQKTITELQERLAAAATERQSLETSHQTAMNDLRIQTHVNSILSGYSFNDTANSMREVVHENIMRKVREKCDIVLKDGVYVPVTKADHDVRVTGQGNAILELKDLIDEQAAQYVKKSDPKGGNTGSGFTGTGGDDDVKKVPANIVGARRGLGGQ